MLGNMQSESSINPAIWQNLDEGNLTGGFGLVQWTPASKYIDWCTVNNLMYTEMDSNLSRILYEVTNNIQWVDATMTFTEFTHSTQSAYDLGIKFLSCYEQPEVPNPTTRGNQAQEWYDLFSPLIVPKKKSKVFLYFVKRRNFVT
jgi:hypothetical protein